MGFEPIGYSNEIFKQRYALSEEETWTQACERVGRQMASVEKRPSYYTEKFAEAMSENLWLPAGRIWYGSGRPQPSLLNCYSLRSELDSAEGWGGVSKELIVTSMRGGGCGINLSDVRPEGAEITGHRGTCPGPLELGNLLNGNGTPIRAGGSRRVAIMLGLSLRHPDIIKFITAKQTPGVLSLCNISVVGDDFSKFAAAVEADEQWELSWKGRYKTRVSARVLWETVISSMYNSGEPGILNRELAEEESTIYYIKKLMITNPCGEQWLEDYGSCCLGHVVLPRFVTSQGELDYQKLADTVRLGTRFLDNVLQITSYPRREMRENATSIRRIGLGVTGLADMFVLMGLRYGSPEALALQDKVDRFIAKVSYDESILLAVEKGAFPSCNPDMHVKSGFVSRMPHKIKARIKEYGIRNGALLTRAPVGSGSILSNNCSSSIEPIFAPAYVREYWKGDELLTETIIHPLFEQFVREGRSIEHFVSSHELSLEEHLRVQEVAQKHVDSSVSKTLNVASDFPIEELSRVLRAHLPNIKGTTVYRDGSRGRSPLTPLTKEQALKMVGKARQGSDVICHSGSCEL
jgi:ribonucleoside-diphosphate reductase alpha chain